MQHRDVSPKSLCRRLFADCLNLSIRALFVVPSLFPILVLISLTAWLSWQHGQQTVEQLALRAQSQIGDRVRFKLESYLAAPQLIARINRDAVRLGQLDLTQLSSVEQHLLTQLSQFKSVSSILIRTDQGSLRAVSRRNGLRLLALDPVNRGQIQNYALSAEGEKTPLEPWHTDADICQFPWHQAASRAESPTWSPILQSSDRQDLCLNASQSILDSQGNVVGVTTSGVSLSDLDQLLNEAGASAAEAVFIVERNGNLISTSTRQFSSQSQQETTQPQKISAANQQDLIQATTQQILNQLGQFSYFTTEQQFSFKQNGSRQFVRVVPHGDLWGLDWLIVIVVSETNFVNQIDRNTRITFLLCLTVGVMPWLMGGIWRGWTKSRQRLSRLSQPVAEANPNCGNFQPLLSDSDLSNQSLNPVAEMCGAFQPTEAAMTSLEAQVRERTAQLCQALAFEDLLRRTTEKVRDSLDEAHILQTVVRELTLGLGVRGCDVSLYNLEAGTSTLCYEHLSDHLNPAQGQTIPLNALPIYPLLLQRQHTQFCLLEPLPAALRSEQAQFACLSCPMMDDQGVLGDLWLFKPKQQSFSMQEIRLVQQIANQCAIALRQSQLYQTAQAQVKELEQLHRIKDDFLSTVSHELRTPMANIKMGTQLLEMSLEHSGFLETADAPIYRYLQILKDEAHREMSLINDLLDLSRVDAGVEPYVVTTIDPQTWIPHVVEPFLERTQLQQQQLQINLAPNLPLLTTDLLDLERILSELLNNACKYTPAGEKIVVTASVQLIPPIPAEQAQNDRNQPVASINRHPLSAPNNPPEPIFVRDLLKQPASSQQPPNSANPPLCFLLKVTNSGVEIPASEQNRIFEKFYRIPSDDPWKCSGTGLGLALVKGLVERLSGQIWVESTAEATTFTVRLPLEVLPSNPRCQIPPKFERT